jgi:putative ABC transport system permease protein
MDRMSQDIRFALRSARRAPAFTAMAVATLAVGIGVSTAAFSVANAILLRPLPVREQERVVVMWAKQRDFAHVPLRWTAIDRYARETRAFERVGGVDYDGARTLPMSDRDGVFPVASALVTGDFFAVLGVLPQIGRLVDRGDDVVNGPPVAVISHGMWKRRYGTDPGVLGRSLRYDGKQFTIVGVAPPGFEYPRGAELWTAVLPLYPIAQNDTAPGALDMVARLRADATMDQGRRELDGFLEREYAKWRGSIGKFEATARTLTDVIVGDVEAAVLTLSGAAALVLLVSCMNVASLLLVRGLARQREIAIRASLGAARARILRQLVTESAVLAGIGTVVGVAVAAAAVRLLAGVAPAEVPRLGDVAVDPRAIAFACATTIVAVLMCGVWPAVVLTRGELAVLMRRVESRSTSRSRGSHRARQAVLVAQAALVVVVVSAAGAFTRSFLNLSTVRLGFHRDDVVVLQLAMPWAKFDASGGMSRFTLLLDQLMTATKAVPGVVAVAVAATPPYSGTAGWDALPSVEGQTEAERAGQPWVNMEIVTASYFETFGVPLVRGRLLASTDRQETPPVAVVNATMARRYWPNGDALGKRFWLGAPGDTLAPRYTVVGVVGDMRYRELTTGVPSFYLPNTQYVRTAPTWFVVRATRSLEGLVAPLRRAFASVDADASVLTARTMDEYLAGPLAGPRFSATLLATFAAVALLLVAVGIYGVVGEYVRQSRRDLGIRLALGAQALDLVRMVVRIALQPVAIGLALGIPVALVWARLVPPRLYEVSPTDPGTLIAVSAILIGVAATACALPTRFAARLNPVDVLREH